jgi:hypothetical protein
VLDQLLAELRAAPWHSERRLERRARDAESLRGDADAPALEVGERDGEPLAARAEQMASGMAQSSS